MSDTPPVVHILRPYATVEEYLEAEAWTIETRSMLLIDAPELPLDTTLLFDVSIKGEKLIRAEGRVAGYVTPTGDSPGGLRVKFRRYGASSKAFIERAVAWRKERADSPRPSSPAPTAPELVSPSVATSQRSPSARPSTAGARPSRPPAPSRPSTPAPSRPSVPAPSRPLAASRPPAPSQRAATAQGSLAPPPPTSSAKPARHGLREPSGVHRRPFGESDVPENRDELLARLRERARQLTRERLDSESGTG